MSRYAHLNYDPSQFGGLLKKWDGADKSLKPKPVNKIPSESSNGVRNVYRIGGPIPFVGNVNQRYLFVFFATIFIKSLTSSEITPSTD